LTPREFYADPRFSRAAVAEADVPRSRPGTSWPDCWPPWSRNDSAPGDDLLTTLVVARDEGDRQGGHRDRRPADPPQPAPRGAGRRDPVADRPA